VKGPDGKISKTTNFSKDQWEEISDMHVRDVWAVHGERDKILLIEGAIRNAVDLLRSRKYIKKRKADIRKTAFEFSRLFASYCRNKIR
jgi:hypothetical protein